MSTKAIIAVLAASFCASAPSGMAEIRIGDTIARQIAKETTLRGKNVDGQCLPFAVALHARFKAAGIPSKIITFNYETLSTPHDIFGEHRAIVPISERGGITGAHAVVAYEDMGRTYIMDNECWQPKWIHNDSPLGMARQFGGMNILVAKARVVGNYRSSKAWAAKMRAVQLLRSSKVLAGRARDSHLFRAHAPSLRPQFIARSNAPLFRLRMAAVELRRGFFAANHHRPLRKEDLLKERSPGVCQHRRRRHFRGSLFALR
jgi:hypothetical protein